MIRSLSLAGLLVLASLAVPAVVAAHGGSADDCTGNLSGVTTGSLNVPSGKTCVLDDVHVDGSITVQTGGGLIVRDSTIDKHVKSDGCTTTQLYLSTIKGEVKISRCTGFVLVGSFPCPIDPYVGGNLKVFDNHGAVMICNVTVEHNIIAHGNDGKFVGIILNRVGNNILAQQQDGKQMNILNNDVEGNINVENNDESTALYVNDNTSHNLNCHGNDVAPIAKRNTADHFVGQC